MQNDCSASIAGKDIKTYKLEMRHRKEALVILEQAEEMKKQQLQCLPIVLTINFHRNHLHQKMQMIVMKRFFAFGLVEFFFFSNEC